jgi:hypothetical protein
LPRSTGALALSALLLTITFTGCQWFKKEKPEQPGNAVARVHDKFLYSEDIRKMLTPGTTREDSILIVTNYVQSWIKQQVILHKAETNLDEEKKDVDKKLEEYRNSLITYIYETELIRQRLDTVVTDPEIEKYYAENQQNFELKDNIIKVLYLRVNRDAPKLKKAREWYRSSNTKDRAALEEYCYQFASDFHLDDETWLLFDDLLKKVPIKTYDKEAFLRNNRFIEIEDSTNIYLVKIADMKIRESLSPLSFVKEDIRNLIINGRKLMLIKEMEKAAYDEALKKNEFEIYD